MQLVGAGGCVPAARIARSLPVPLFVPAECVGEAGIALAAPDGPFGEPKAPPEVGEPRGAGGGARVARAAAATTRP